MKHKGIGKNLRHRGMFAVREVDVSPSIFRIEACRFERRLRSPAWECSQPQRCVISARQLCWPFSWCPPRMLPITAWETSQLDKNSYYIGQRKPVCRSRRYICRNDQEIHPEGPEERESNMETRQSSLCLADRSAPQLRDGGAGESVTVRGAIQGGKH